LKNLTIPLSVIGGIIKGGDKIFNNYFETDIEIDFSPSELSNVTFNENGTFVKAVVDMHIKNPMTSNQDMVYLQVLMNMKMNISINDNCELSATIDSTQSKVISFTPYFFTGSSSYTV